jgi:NAD(P)H-flavin reductase/ferredoxin
MRTVRLEPIGEAIDVAPGETVLDASFRQGYNLAYGCREGQCSACKCFLLEGDVELKPYSSFALSDTERENGYSLMCRAMPETDAVVELLHYDPDAYRLDHAIRDGAAVVAAVGSLTADITRLELEVQTPTDFAFTPGQYIDLHVPGDADARRSFSLANLPDPTDPRLELFIKRYPGGRISGLLESGAIAPGTRLNFTGPYGAMKTRPGDSPVLMIAGGSGMAPIMSLLRAFAAGSSARPVRVFYGARSEDDLFHTAEITAAGAALADFAYVPVTGRFVHEAVDAFLAANPAFAVAEVYMCGPPPMLEAAEDMLLGTHHFDTKRIYQDKFTTSAQASASTAGAGATAPPAKRIGPDPGAGAGASAHDSERQFGWFTPAKRRATLYEDVTVDTQPSIHRHVTRGWPVSFADGRGTWDDRSTQLCSVDWFAFRDPGEQWERPYYVAGNAGEQQIERAISSATEEGLLADFRPEWVGFLKAFLQLPAYVEHGLWFAGATAARDALSDSVSQCMALGAAMKQRSAQALVLYAMDLEPFHGEFPMADARRTFLEAPEWQPTRRLLERLAATWDWCEVIFAANLCFEPVIGTLLRRELGIRAAAANGDVVTPVLAGVATQEWEWARAWSTALARFLLEDPEHGPANRDRLRAWVEDWLPAVLAAGEALVPLADRLPVGIDIAAALVGIRAYSAAVLIEAGLGELAPLLGVAAPAPSPTVEIERDASDPGLAGPGSSPTRRVRSGTARRSKVGGPAAGDAAPDAAGSVVDAVTAAVPLTDITRAPAEDGSYDFVGIVMAKSAEGDAVAEVMRRRDGVVVHEHAAFWDVRAEDRLVMPYDEISEALGYAIDSYSIQHEMTTHYGRMVATDDCLMLFSDPTEAMQYLMA